MTTKTCNSSGSAQSRENLDWKLGDWVVVLILY